MGRGMSPEQALLRRIGRNSNSYDSFGGRGRGRNHADEVLPMVTNGGMQGGKSPVTVGQGLFNPQADAQIQLSVLKLYFTEAAGVYTPILPAAVAAALQTSLPFFAFLNLDFSAGYAQLQSLYPQALWAYNAPVVYGKDQNISSTRPLANGKWDTNVTALLRLGDVILPFTATSGGTNYVALVVLRVSDVAYGSLLESTNSNTFEIDLIRYRVVAGQETQFQNSIKIADETMFGRLVTDPVNPESFKNPEQDQDNIIDLDIKVPINKQRGFASLTNYDVVNITLNLFINNVSKIV